MSKSDEMHTIYMTCFIILRLQSKTERSLPRICNVTLPRYLLSNLAKIIINATWLFDNSMFVLQLACLVTINYIIAINER